jgi:toxin ParE1/3/4
MAFRVELTQRAARDLRALFLEIHAADSKAAAHWFNRLEKAIASLSEMPDRNPVAPESANPRRPIRHLLYGRKPNVYRVLYQVMESRNTVMVLHVRHGARRALTG